MDNDDLVWCIFKSRTILSDDITKELVNIRTCRGLSTLLAAAENIKRQIL